MGFSLEALSAATFEKHHLFILMLFIGVLSRSHVIGQSTIFIVSFSLPLDVAIAGRVEVTADLISSLCVLINLFVLLHLTRSQ